MVAAVSTAEQTTQTVILHNVSWTFYRTMQAEMEDVCNPRLAYYNGALEITLASFEHEHINRSIAELFTIIADGVGIDFLHSGSTTFDREDLERGFQPDSSFYIGNADRVRGKTRIKLAVDPPPDLVIEIDITHQSLNQLPIFAGLGIAEVWRYRKGALTILKLDGGQYLEQAESLCLPGVTAERLTQFIADSQQMKRADWLQQVRDWVKALRQSS